MYEGNTLSMFATPSCVVSPRGAHKFDITFVEEISALFRCCEVCGKTSRLRNIDQGFSQTWEEIKEPAQKEMKA